MVKSMPGPICSESGAYMVQPAAWAPPGTKNETVNSVAPTGSSQKLKLFMRAKAMSDAPICKGIIQLAKPTNAGMIRSEEHTSELQSLMRISYAVLCLKQNNKQDHEYNIRHNHFT